ncbi:MAG: acyl--CoA ligase [Proteobacteria bacterium]|nr:acyl--CoA ligase [Pseudomonadota bacterium]
MRLIDARPGHERAWTGQELGRDVERAAGWLAARGVRDGDRVVLSFGSSAELVLLVLGCLHLGASAVPVSPASSDREKAFFAEHSKAVLVVTEPPEDLGEEQPEATQRAEREAFLLYTSGSTGNPKGVRVAWSAAKASARDTALHFGMGPGTRMYCVLDPSHGHGLIVGILTPILCGGTCVIDERFNAFSAARFWPTCAKHEVTCFTSVPAVLRTLLRLTDTGAPTVRFGLCASAPLSERFQAEFEARFGFPLANNYGMTETATWMTRGHLTGDRHPGSVGTPLPDTLRIVDGEVQVRGPQVTDGYLDNPDATASLFDGEWMRTGDLGRLVDGFLYLDGRAKEVIDVGAEKVYPQDVEERLLEHPNVLGAAVVGAPSKRYGEEPVAFVLVDGEADLRAWCREGLASYKVPRRVVVLEDFPRLRTGKVDRAALRERARG